MKQRMKRFLSVLLSIAMVLTISLPVLAEESNDDVVHKKANTTTFDKVSISVQDDDQAEIYLYKIINVMDKMESEDDNAKVEKEAYAVEWVSEELKGLVKDYNPATELPISSAELANNPTLLSKLSDKEADAFYQYLAKYIQNDMYEKKEDGTFEAGSSYGCEKVSVSVNPTTSGTTTIHVFANVATGGYLALASGGVNVYRPTSVNLLPESDDGNTEWNTKTPRELSMKASKPTIDKTVTDIADGMTEGAETATVAKNDSLSFDIYTEVPEYSSDYTENKIRYTMVDIISTAFTYDTTDGAITMTGYHVDENGQKDAGETIASTSYTAATAGKVYVDADGTILFISDNLSTPKFYWPDGGIMLTDAGENVNTLAAALNVYNNKKNASLETATVSKTQYAIIVDFSGKFSSIKDYNEIGFHYNVKVSADVKVDAANSNTAELAYTTNPKTPTETSSVEDTVKVYTFGLDVTKLDGSNTDVTGSNIRLNGVTFDLYEKLGPMTDDEYNELVTGAAEGDYRDKAEESGVVTVYHRIYSNLMTDTVTLGEGDTATEEDGKLIVNGLDVGDYELVEVGWLEGYNPLTDPIPFTITQDRSTPQNIDGEENGYISQKVYNYQGITLPSTGGMGITMFVIIGMGVAGAAIIMLRTQRRKIYR